MFTIIKPPYWKTRSIWMYFMYKGLTFRVELGYRPGYGYSMIVRKVIREPSENADLFFDKYILVEAKRVFISPANRYSQKTHGKHADLYLKDEVLLMGVAQELINTFGYEVEPVL